eukprot:TRINITY_DN16232_c0_g1_i1.p1 TRINITY_DN16232_c0_g1~~TRINITY_DN16232_c0_g1_i1.p1  ORF type:complete len:166 (+),score=25.84 TRINITY_DN16232_c0_g1_i1:138-635(+)
MQAKILMLDEATSALDTWSQNHVCHTVQERLGCTCLFITTRMTAARNANHIAVVSHGRCEEEGTHEELLARGGLYARILSEEAEAGDGVSPVPEARDDHAPTDRVADPQVAALERVFSPFHAPPPADPPPSLCCIPSTTTPGRSSTSWMTSSTWPRRATANVPRL